MSFKAWTKEKEIRENEIKKRDKNIKAAFKKMQDEFNAKYPITKNKLDFYRRKRIWISYFDNFVANLSRGKGAN